MQISDAERNIIYGYTRVSTAAQDESGQVNQLKAVGCGKIFREKITGMTAERPQLGKPMKRLVPGDVVITPAVDRLSRDTIDLLVIARDAARRSRYPFARRTLPRHHLRLCRDRLYHSWRGREAGAPPHSRTHSARPDGRQRQGCHIRPQAELTPHQQKEASKPLEAGETQRSVARSHNVGQSTISRLTV